MEEALKKKIDKEMLGMQYRKDNLRVKLLLNYLAT